MGSHDTHYTSIVLLIAGLAHGVMLESTEEKYYFGCKIVSDQPVETGDVDTSLNQQHVCCVGVPRGDDPIGNLGETGLDFGYRGEGFVKGDIIVCLVDLKSKPFASVEFFKRG